MYGAMLVAMPCWAGGTALGVVMGNLLPARLVSALSVALSLISGYVPGFSSLSDGTRTIVLTVALSSAAALLFPVNMENAEEATHGA